MRVVRIVPSTGKQSYVARSWSASLVLTAPYRRRQEGR